MLTRSLLITVELNTTLSHHLLYFEVVPQGGTSTYLVLLWLDSGFQKNPSTASRVRVWGGKQTVTGVITLANKSRYHDCSNSVRWAQAVTRRLSQVTETPFLIQACWWCLHKQMAIPKVSLKVIYTHEVILKWGKLISVILRRKNSWCRASSSKNIESRVGEGFTRAGLSNATEIEPKSMLLGCERWQPPG